MQQKVSTLFLKVMIISIGLSTIVFSIPVLRFSLSPENVDYLPHLITFYLSIIPFIVSLYQTLKLLNLVDNNKAFSESSVKALKNIKYCAIIFATLYIVVMPYVYFKGDIDDAPGPIAIGLTFIFGAIVSAAAVSVLQKLIQKALDLKKENDLTV